MTNYGEDPYPKGRETSTNFEKARSLMLIAIKSGASVIEVLDLLDEARRLAMGTEVEKIEEDYSRGMKERENPSPVVQTC